MRALQYRSSAGQLQRDVVALLRQRLRPTDYSRRCTAAVLLGCLVLAAARRLSLAAVAAVRRDAPSRETLRQALYATLPDYDGLRRRLPGLLRASLPRRLARHPGRRYPLAVDLHRVAYYKRGRTPPVHARKGQRLAGTRYAHDYATLSLLRKGRYYTLAVTPYGPGDDLAGLVRRLLRQAAGLGFSPRYLLLDRTFWAVDVFRYLYRAHCPFVLPVAARGKGPRAPGGPTGTQAFFHGRAGGSYRYRLANAHKRSAWVTVVVVRRRRPDRRGRRVWAYAVWRAGVASARAVRERYRRRFRIESSYRLLEAARGRTSSRDEGLRLWYVVLAVLLANVWLALRRRPAGPEGRAPAWYTRALAVLAQLLLEAPAGAEAQAAATPGVARTGPGP
jgi:putative transposase